MNFFAISLALLLGPGFQQARVPSSPNATAEDQVRRLIESLPAGSRWRDMLQHGARGEGIHHPWMDDMRRQEVKLAIFTFEFAWTQRGKQRKDWTMVGSEYFLDYDRSEPITDEGQLAQLRSDGGLEQHLEMAALAKAKTAHWFESPAEESGVGYRQEYVADNEWLPVDLTPFLGPYEPGTTRLMHAALLGDVQRIQKLLKHGADVNAISPDGSTALVYASSSGNPLAVETLLKAGASARTKAGGHSLLTAAAGGNARTVELLLQAGADPNFRDNDGATALSTAEWRHYTRIVELLKQAGARN